MNYITTLIIFIINESIKFLFRNDERIFKIMTLDFFYIYFLVHI